MPCGPFNSPTCICFFAAVSASLEDSLGGSAKATLQAIGAQEAAVQAITQHTHKLKEAMEKEVLTHLSTKLWSDSDNDVFVTGCPDVSADQSLLCSRCMSNLFLLWQEERTSTDGLSNLRTGWQLFMVWFLQAT
ncbi:hypothetical protein XENOCAPTIV_022641 [Xenoophorus captivus]|uniref:Uncharacterized protein n=1 Tax=Xenoophorus captivus TaxID=1517983 RepID=A0ABV0RTN1_9TELE